MANQLLTIDMITLESVRLFKNSNLFIMNMDTQYDSAFAIDGAKIGQTLRIRLPSDYVVMDGPALQLQDTVQQYTTLTIDAYKHVAIPFTSVEKTMTLDNFSELVLAPAVNNLAGKVAQIVMNNTANDVCNFVSNVDGAGNIISPTSEQFLLANAVLDNNSADQMTRRVVNDPVTDARTTVSLQGLLNPSQEISQQFRSGMMKSGLGYERWFRDQTVIKHTTGTFSAGGTIAGGDQTGTEITVAAITGTILEGDIITIDGVNAVNRVTKADLGELRQFVVLEDVANGGTTIDIYPALTPAVGGNDVQFQTVVASPSNGAQVRLVTKASEVYRKSIAYVQKAITLGTADLVLVKNAVIECARAEYDGISMRILTDYLNQSDQIATRIDVLFGSRVLRPEWCCVVADRM